MVAGPAAVTTDTANWVTTGTWMPGRIGTASASTFALAPDLDRPPPSAR